MDYDLKMDPDCYITVSSPADLYSQQPEESASYTPRIIHEIENDNIIKINAMIASLLLLESQRVGSFTAKTYLSSLPTAASEQNANHIILSVLANIFFCFIPNLFCAACVGPIIFCV